MVKEYFPNDTDGYMYKMQPWFEFAPFPSGSTISFSEDNWVTLNEYTTTAGARRWRPIATTSRFAARPIRTMISPPSMR